MCYDIDQKFRIVTVPGGSLGCFLGREPEPDDPKCFLEGE